MQLLRCLECFVVVVVLLHLRIIHLSQFWAAVAHDEEVISSQNTACCDSGNFLTKSELVVQGKVASPESGILLSFVTEFALPTWLMSTAKLYLFRESRSLSVCSFKVLGI